ncbi:MAG: hypothetical protein HFG30_07665 [Eubacterium sp.]|nr:hypothetical protein [Eubacterium sp.]
MKKLIMIFLLGAISLFTLNVKADTIPSKVTFIDGYLTFEVWQGKGNSSVSIGDDYLTKNLDIVEFDEFEELQYEGKMVDKSHFTVMKSGLNTIITLKEEYLKTLKDGDYSFEAVFAKAIIPLKLHIVTHKVNLTDAYFTFGAWAGSGTAIVNLTEGMFSYKYYLELFEGLWYKGEKLKDSCYIIRKFQNVTTIILKEEYLITLSNGEHYFTAEFMNVSVKLKLKINKIIKVKKPVRVKNVKKILKKKKIKVTWKKQKNVTGYEIKFGTNKKLTKNIKKIKIRKNKNSVIVRGLKKNKKYYLKVRAYKVIEGKKYWGVWSTRTTLKNYKNYLQ